MNNAKLIEYLKRWRDLEQKARDLDYERSAFAHDLRSEWPTGNSGDTAMSKWCEVELGLGVDAARELAARAQAISFVPDKKDWPRLGGFKAITRLAQVPKRERVEIVEACKATGKAIATLLRERALGEAKRPRSAIEDATTLALYLSTLDVELPRRIRDVVERYTDVAASRRAA